MCGIAGRFDLQGARDTEPEMLVRMGTAIRQRGPDQSGWLSEPGFALISQRLAIVGLDNGRQPIENEDGSVVVVCNGEFFDHRELRRHLEQRGHLFRSESDCEILVHLWEEHGESFFEHLRGQFAFALLDRRRRTLILARDRMGICPLYTCQSEGWLYFGSEVKALLASGQIAPRVDPLAIDHAFSFFAVSMRRTMFAGVEAILPGHYLKLTDGGVSDRQYWDLGFPDQGQELRGPELAARLGEKLEHSVALRLRADVPVVSYLSGGVDSSLVASLATRQLGRPIPTFSIRILQDKLDEVPRALLTARHIGSQPTIVECGSPEIADTYPALIRAAESPVIDTSSAAIFRLATAVRQAGYKVALSGEGADEALAGYPWFKFSRLINLFDSLGQGEWLRRRLFRKAAWSYLARRYECMGGWHGTSDLYAACSLSGSLVYSDAQRELVGKHSACEDLVLNLQGMRGWHPLNRALYLGYKVMLPGLLMTHKGDRPAMANSVETRFPFLDEGVVDFCATIDPDLKLKGWFRDKHLLRCYAAGHLPAAVANRPKHIFRARYAGSLLDPAPDYVRQLLSRESLHKTGYFDWIRVEQARSRLGKAWSRREDLALVGVIATQLWHHLFLGGGLCDL